MHEASRILNVGKRDQLVVSIHEFKSRFGVDIRYYYTDELNQLRPTHRGIRVPVEAASELIIALQGVLEDCEKTVQLPKKVVAKKPVRRKK
jgi:hypothetical protein